MSCKLCVTDQKCMDTMNRRTFLTTSSLALIALTAPALGQTTYRKARVNKRRHSGTDKSYSHRRIADPTRQIGGRVERFELRGGDCSSNEDCTARRLGNRMVTRARVEKVWETALRKGDSGLFRYKLYLPSNEYSAVSQFGTAMGQVLAAFRRGNTYDSFPLFTFNTDRGSSRVYAAMSEAQIDENQPVKYREFDIGNLRRNLLDRWISVQIAFRLSTGTDGALTVNVDGRKLGTFKGRTILDDGFLEIRYGLYQTGTNHYPGGAGAIPTQVAYFAQPELLQAH